MYSKDAVASYYICNTNGSNVLKINLMCLEKQLALQFDQFIKEWQHCVLIHVVLQA